MKRRLALGSSSNSTVPCTTPGEKKKGRPCMTCTLVSGTCETPYSDKHPSVLGPGDINDDNVLGAHLFSVHNKRDKSDFNNCFLFDVLCTTSENIRKSEQFFIDKLRTLYPFGLNNIKSISGS